MPASLRIAHAALDMISRAAFFWARSAGAGWKIRSKGTLENSILSFILASGSFLAPCDRA